MKIRQERLVAFSAFAALALGAAGSLFERANPSVLSGTPAELASWTRAHHTDLVAQSVLFGLSTAPMLVFFTGLRAVLRRRDRRAGARVDPSLVVLGAGAAWVTVQLVAQGFQVTIAGAAAAGAPADTVASRSSLMRRVLGLDNLALGTALGAVADIGLRGGALPRWLGWQSALTAALSGLSVAALGVRRGPLSADGPLAYLPYATFVAWLAATAVVLLRTEADQPAVAPVRPRRPAGSGPFVPRLLSGG